MTPEEIQTKVIAILTNQVAVIPQVARPITPACRMQEDLGLDSLDDVEIIMQLEDEFDIVLPDEEADELKTVQDLLTCVERKVAE